jgi:hypothetical protein
VWGREERDRRGGRGESMGKGERRLEMHIPYTEGDELCVEAPRNRVNRTEEF